jgi:hypothetical protein
MSNDWPLLLQFLGEFDFKIKIGTPALGYQLFFIDLSPWKLRLSHFTPVIWVRSDDSHKVSPLHLFQSLQDVIRERGLHRRTTLVLLEGDGTALQKHATDPLHNLVIIDANAHEKIIQSRRPSGELLDLISAQIPISNLAPYEISSPVTGSRFFGREYEISKIRSNPDTNFLILGIRRIGKTSLLQEIKRIFEEDRNFPFVEYIDCSELQSTYDYVQKVVRDLNPKELPRLHLQEYAFFFPHFLERMKQKYGGKIIFLLDELDNLLVKQRGDWELISMLRASANKGICQYVMAGYSEALKELYLLDNPLFKSVHPIRLNEFTRQQAHKLIVTPMENLGVNFKNTNEVVGRIYEETAGHPNLIQYYCMILMKKLDQTGTREISPDSLIDIYTDEGFKNHLLSSFMYNTRNREKAVVYATLRYSAGMAGQSFSQADIDAALKKQDIIMLQNDIDNACNVLILAGIFHQKGKDYSFTSPVFSRMLTQSYDLQYLLKKIKEEGI